MCISTVHVLRLCTVRTAHRGSRGVVFLFLDHGTRSRFGVNIMSRLFLPTHQPPGKTLYSFYRILDGIQCSCVEVRKISSQPRFEPRSFQPIASRYTAYANRNTNYKCGCKYSSLFIEYLNWFMLFQFNCQIKIFKKIKQLLILSKLKQYMMMLETIL